MANASQKQGTEQQAMPNPSTTNRAWLAGPGPQLPRQAFPDTASRSINVVQEVVDTCKI